MARPVVSCNAAADLMQTVAKKAQDFGKFAAVLGASALVANVRSRGPAARLFAGPVSY